MGHDLINLKTASVLEKIYSGRLDGKSRLTRQVRAVKLRFNLPDARKALACSQQLVNSRLCLVILTAEEVLGEEHLWTAMRM